METVKQLYDGRSKGDPLSQFSQLGTQVSYVYTHLCCPSVVYWVRFLPLQLLLIM